MCLPKDIEYPDNFELSTPSTQGFETTSRQELKGTIMPEKRLDAALTIKINALFLLDKPFDVRSSSRFLFKIALKQILLKMLILHTFFMENMKGSLI